MTKKTEVKKEKAKNVSPSPVVVPPAKLATPVVIKTKANPDSKKLSKQAKKEDKKAVKKAVKTVPTSVNADKEIVAAKKRVERAIDLAVKQVEKDFNREVAALRKHMDTTCRNLKALATSVGRNVAIQMQPKTKPTVGSTLL